MSREILSKELQKNSVHYRHLLKNSNNYIINKEFDVVVVIESRGNKKLVSKNLDYIKEASSFTKLKVGAIVVEVNNMPTVRLEVIERGFAYIFIDKNFNRDLIYNSYGLSYNTAFYAINNAKYYIFNDINFLVGLNFFNVLEKHYIAKGIDFIQNYLNNTCKLLDFKTTKLILNSQSSIVLRQLVDQKQTIKSFSKTSFTIKREKFLESGGFDPELKLRYPLEYNFFILKALCTIGKVDPYHDLRSNTNLLPVDSYPDLYYLNYPNMSEINLHSYNLFNAFDTSTYNEKLDYIKIKSKIFIGEIANNRR